jgi:putative ABC transport system permease protein
MCAGQLLAYAASRALTRFLYGVSPTDAVTLLTTTGLLTLVALAASAVPAWQITRTDPVCVMRND